MGGDILSLCTKLKDMQIAYIDFNAVEKVTNSVERWSMLKKLCYQHEEASIAGTAALPSAETAAK
ncbi:MAG: hypothetical protein JO218_12510 [Burkholderiales bacterium]|nr:hypothetical protein [Burkholderiales bacterium]